MARGVVVTYFSRSGAPLRAHQRALLASDARAIAAYLKYEFVEDHDRAAKHDGHVYYVPDDTILTEEARCLGIQQESDLFGGAVPRIFVKTKSITHPLVNDNEALRPDGWSIAFTKRVADVVLAGYTVFSQRDARIAAGRMLPCGPIRVKQPLEAGGRGQTVVSKPEKPETLLEHLSPVDMASTGLVLEENLVHVRTLSVGRILVADIKFTYFGRQRLTVDNKGRSVYGGSDLVCVRGGWDDLERSEMNNETGIAVKQARLYDEAMSEYPGFIASRRNYDVGQGIDYKGQLKSGVLESSWRVGGATPAELAALTRFADDPSVTMVEASHLEKFGPDCNAPPGAIIHFRGDDPDVGPLTRYTLVGRIARSTTAG
jgi:Protein of unknown function (DUF3182)